MANKNMDLTASAAASGDKLEPVLNFEDMMREEEMKDSLKMEHHRRISKLDNDTKFSKELDKVQVKKDADQTDT